MKTLLRKKITTKAWTLRNWDKVLQWERRYAQKRARLIARIKDRPCMDCHGWFEPCQMDFDHRPDENKLYNVPQMQLCSLKKVVKEIHKCDIVCANCHRLRTTRRRILLSKGMEE